MTYGHPYTTFDRHNGLTIEETILQIRKIIIEESPESVQGPVFRAYKAIYDSANTSDIPGDNGMGNYTKVSQLAEWAKDNAFVFLVGMNANGQLLDVIDTTGATRNALEIEQKTLGLAI